MYFSMFKYDYFVFCFQNALGLLEYRAKIWYLSLSVKNDDIEITKSTSPTWSFNIDRWQIAGLDDDNS